MAESPVDLLIEAVAGLRSGADLPPDHIPGIATALLADQVGDPLRIEFLTLLADKGETPREVAGFAQAYLPLAVDPGLSGHLGGRALIDCCGTGGGGVDLVNISTALMFVMAAAGVPVVKHGNKGLTKKSGSADVLTALGIRIDSSPEASRKLLEETGCCFYMAPRYHPAFKAVAPARQALGARGRRTIFNYLGPLLNPARPATQMVGLFRPEGLDFYQSCLQEMGRKRFLLVYGESETGQPIGEASVFGPTRMRAVFDGQRYDECREAATAGSLDDLRVSSAEESAARIEAAFRGEAREALLREMLAFNAGLGLWTQGAAPDAPSGVEWARDLIAGGAAADVLDRVRE